MRPLKREAPPNSTLGMLAGHPIRIEAFIILGDREASASEIAAELGEETNLVSYHVRKLEEVGAIELVAQRSGRGNAVEKIYRAVEKPITETPDSARLPKSDRESISMPVLRRVFADIARAVGAGTFDSRHDRTLIRAPGLLDSEGFERLSRELDAVYKTTVEVFEESANRLANDPDSEAIPVVVSTMLFERPSRDACS